MTEDVSLISESRMIFHQEMLSSVLFIDEKGIPSNADRYSNASKAIALNLYNILQGSRENQPRLVAQTSGKRFEEICRDFLHSSFAALSHLRPGKWHIVKGKGIHRFEQYRHLHTLRVATNNDHELAAALGRDYLINTDLALYREPEDDTFINTPQFIVDDKSATRAYLRKSSGSVEILHAVISMKWTIRSDRGQNIRTEALNLMRNRKGPLPHIIAVVGEPWPARIASVALGTGDIDCVYHVALTELQEAVDLAGDESSKEMLAILVDGKRLKDISDLPLDLAV